MSSNFFPSVGMQVLSSLIHFLGVTVVTHCLSRRFASINFSLAGLFELRWARLCLLLVFIDSWAFLFTGGVLIFGVGLEKAHSICNGAILLCIACYATSKVLIYLFLIERVHAVWAPTTRRTSRLKSPVDRLCFATIIPYCVVIALLLVGRISELRGVNQACVIGLKPLASIPLLSYDLYINLFLAVLFFWPLLKHGYLSPKAKRLAARTLIASVASLVTSTVNIAVLTGHHGREYGWVCLGSCGVDVIVNAVALYWATLPTKNQRQRAPTISVVGANDAGSIFTVTTSGGRRLSMAPYATPSQTAMYGGLQEPYPADHYSNPFVAPRFIPQSPLPQVSVTAQSELAAPSPCYGVLGSMSRLLKRAEAPKSDKDHPIEVTVTTHLEVEDEVVSHLDNKTCIPEAR